jgi:hypothetical protein
MIQNAFFKAEIDDGVMLRKSKMRIGCDEIR